MDLNRFAYGVAEIVAELRSIDLTTQFRRLETTLNTFSASQTGPNSDLFKASLSEFLGRLNRSSLNEPDADVAQTIDLLDLENDIGQRLADRIHDVVVGNQLSPTLTQEALTRLNSEVATVLAPVIALDESLGELGVSMVTVPPGEGEIGVRIPVARDHDTLHEFAIAAKEWDHDISAIVEVFDADRPQVRLTTVATGSWQLYLACTPPVLYGVLRCLKEVNAILAELVQTRRLVEQLVAVNMNPQVVEDARKHAAESGSTRFEALADALVDENYKGDPARRNELVVSTRRSLKRLAKKIAAGTKVTLRLGVPEKREPSDQDDVAATALIEQNTRDIEEARRLNAEARALVFEFKEADIAGLLAAPADEQIDD